MKLVVEHSETKRRIDGPLGICGSREDLESLVNQICAKLNDQSWAYGWVFVHPTNTLKRDTPPKGWDE